MGSHNLEVSLPGSLGRVELSKAFSQLQEEAAHQSGHNSYSGDWNTMRGLSIAEHAAFENLEAARDFVLDHTQKWEAAMAVRYHDRRPVYTKQPTFAGHPHRGFGYNDRQALGEELPFSRGERGETVPADQLTESQKKQLLALVARYDGATTELIRARSDLRTLAEQIIELSALPKQAEIAQRQSRVKRARVEEERAQAALVKFCQERRRHLYQTRTDDGGLKWLIAGWAAI